MDEFDEYDVVKELRDAQDSPHWQRDSYKYMCKVAADEIERLRNFLEIISDKLYDKQDYELWAAVRNTLWQEGENNG
jgi:hypothetical protein